MSVMICGCASTQTTAARLRLNDDRIRASQLAIAPSSIGQSRTVSTGSVTVLSADGGYTAVVSLKNSSPAAVSDLPILVGYRLKAHTVYLNAGTQSDYFNNHIPAIAGHGSLTWVGGGRTSIPRHARFFATVGARASSPVGSGWKAPVITASVSNQSAAGGPVTVHVDNTSGIPQYQLPVYAVVAKNGHILSAGDGSIATLNGGAKAVVKLSVAASGGQVQVEAPGTIFK